MTTTHMIECDIPLPPPKGVRELVVTIDTLTIDEIALRRDVGASFFSEEDGKALGRYAARVYGRGWYALAKEDKDGVAGTRFWKRFNPPGAGNVVDAEGHVSKWERKAKEGGAENSAPPQPRSRSFPPPSARKPGSTEEANND